MIPFQSVYYPESDGKPLGETEIHVEEIIYLRGALVDRFRDDPDVYVGTDLFLYYEEGNPRAVVCPDVFVAKGAPKLPLRRKWLLWEEGVGPCLVVEITSADSRNEDLHRKKDRYERLGVEEYVLFDPTGDYLDPRLRGFRLVNGRYQEIPFRADGSLRSLTTGVIFRLEGERLRLVDAATDEPLLRDEEVRERRRRVEEELARLRAELESLGG
ncbi:MAG TPA: Uma2 family endonuclease [Thermoanaerobaculia bacterium]